MFLSFGKKSSSAKKSGTPVGSPNSASSSAASPSVDASARSTVQTVAGPLLSSTRFNTILDASTYANVSSPGFTSRVVNCASNGSTSYGKTATHQSKYSSVGLFPKVHLGGQSTLPILSPHNSQKVGRTPVRIRIAPPSFPGRRRHSTCDSPPDITREPFKRSPSLQPLQSKESSTSSPKRSENVSSMPDNYQEASRKRIFSESQDVHDEAKKRRKKAEIHIPNPNNDIYHYRHVRAPAVPSSPPQLDLSSQGKRAREKGSPEEQKRQRRKTCNLNNAIFSSLSSSRNLLERLKALKRKSADTYRASSPLIPLSGKQSKESKTVSDVQADQPKLDGAPKPVKSVEHIDTPVSSKTIGKRIDSVKREFDLNVEKEPVKDCQPSCDYTTKLFRKDVSAHSPRPPVTKSQKNSLWVQPPEADELTCSLLSNDTNLDRPERLKSLLACVSGKDKKAEERKATVSTSVQKEAVTQVSINGISLPVSTSAKTLSPLVGSPLSALTVTVSSTSTIMTSATVTSVNGVPSSESNCSPRPVSASLVASPIQSSHPATSAVHLPQTSTITLPSLGKPLGIAASSASITSVSTALPNSSNSLALTTRSPYNQAPKASNEAGKPSANTFTMKSPVGSSASSANSVETSKLSFQFSSENNPSAATSTLRFQTTSTIQTAASRSSSTFESSSKPSFQFGSLADKTSLVPNPAFQFKSNSPSTAPSSTPSSVGSNFGVSKPASSFESPDTSTSVAPSSAFQFGANAVAPNSNDSTSSSSKPAFSFGASASGPSKPAVQFGSSANGSLRVPKTTLQLEGSNNLLPVTPQSASQWNSSGTANIGSATAPQPSFQFGSSGTTSNGLSGPQKPSLQFESSVPIVNGSSEASKSTFQFGSSSSLASTKAAFQFEPSANGRLETNKNSLTFGAAGSVMTTASTPSFQFEPSTSGPPSSGNPAFQFGGGSNTASSTPKPIQFGSNANGANDTAKSPFQLGSSLSNSSNSVKPAFSFSTNAGTKPTFGSENSSSVFGQTVPQQTKGAFTFGSVEQSSNQSSTNEKGGFTFSISGSASGSGTSSPFGSGSTSAFGAPTNSNQSTQPFGVSTYSNQSTQPFGSLSDTKSNGFGSTGFGSTTSTFSFNSDSASNPSSSLVGGSNKSSGSFSFGSKQDQAPSAFSFSANVTAVPSPTTQVSQDPGLFSIGAGSTSTQRRAQTARRRR